MKNVGFLDAIKTQIRVRYYSYQTEKYLRFIISCLLGTSNFLKGKTTPKVDQKPKYEV